MSIERVAKTQVFPSNIQAKYSFRNGNPVINFQLGSQEAFLDGRSVRLNFKLKVLKSDGTPPNNNDNTGSGTAVNIRLNERIGAWSVIDRFVVSEVSRNQTIETTLNTGRVLCTVMPSQNSALEYDTSMSTMGTGSRQALAANYLNKSEVSVSLPLHKVSGLLRSGMIPLNRVPLNLQIQLAADSMALITTATDGDTAAFYEVAEPFVSCDLMMPDDALRQKMMSESAVSISYDTYATIFNVQNASHQTTNLNWGLSNVTSVFSNLLPTTHTNNILQDSYATGEFRKGAAYTGKAIVDRVGFLRASQLSPIQNELEIKTQNTEGRPAVPLLKHGLGSTGRPWAKTKHTLADLSTQCQMNADLLIDGVPVNTLSDVSRTQPTTLKTYGVDLDSYSNQGVDFKNVSCGLRVDGDMDGANPMGIYSTCIARNTLVANDAGIQVLA